MTPYKFLSNIWFTTKISWIFTSQTTYYFVGKHFGFCDFSNYIVNLAHRLSKENILYVKLFQALSLENKWIPKDTLLEFTDKAPYTNDDVDWEGIRQLNEQYNIKIQSENGTTPITQIKPINSGMISLVYKGKDPENHEVIVKIKRKGIDDKLAFGIEKLMFLLGLCSHFSQTFQKLQIVNSVEKNLHMISEQLDFQKEVENTKRMAQNCRFLSYVKIPKVYGEVTETIPNIIVQEYLDGKSLSKILKSDCEMFAPLVLKYGFVSTFIHGFTHGDLHSGNLIFMKIWKKTKKNLCVPQYQLGLIDFGIVLEIKESVRNTFLNLATQMYSKPATYLAEKLFRCFVNNFEDLPNEQKEKMIEATGEIIDSCLRQDKQLTNQTRIYELLWKLNESLCEKKQSGIELNDDFVKMQMGLAMTNGLTMCLCEGDYVDYANKVVNDLFHLDILDFSLDT